MTQHKLADPYCNFQYQEVIVRLYVGPPLFILTCIGFNVIKTSKEKQKVILQFMLFKCMHVLVYNICSNLVG